MSDATATSAAHEPIEGLRERGKNDKRRRIVQAARDVFIEHGFDAATTREIAVRAEVSTGTVFVYAKDKRDLLLMIVNDELDAIGAQAAEALAKPGTLRERLLGYFRLRYRYWAAEPRLARPALAQTSDFAGAEPASGDEARRFARRQRMLVQLRPLVHAAQRSGEVVGDVRAELVAGLMVDVYLVEVRRWLADDAPRLATGMRRLDAVLGLLLRRAGAVLNRHPHLETTMSLPPIVLVHGAWGGAWIWRRVLGPLRAAGHEVHAVTLTGDGERAHLRRRDITLQTHIQDVVALVENEELGNVVLVGHSYGGQVVTGAADRLLAARPGAVGRLVYVDAMVPLPGEGWGDQHSAEVVASRTALAEANDFALPAPAAGSGFGLNAEDAAWLDRHHVPHPFGPYREPLPFDGERWAQLPRAFIDCHQPAYATIAAMRARVREMPGFEVFEMATGHFPMVSQPQQLAQLLLKLAAR